MSGTTKSKTLFACVATVILTLIVCFYSMFSFAQNVRKYGFDFWDSYESARSIFVIGDSYHDPKHRMDSDPEILNGFLDIPRYCKDSLAHIRKVGITTIQSHPVLGAWYFYPYLSSDINHGFKLYNIAQALLWCGTILLLAAAVQFSIGLEGSRVRWILTSLFLIVITLAPAGPIMVNLAWGQTNITVLFFIALFLYLLTRKYRFVAGLALSLAVVDKILPILLLAMIPRKSIFKVSAGVAAGIAYIAVVMFLFTGKVFIFDLLQYPSIMERSNYNVLSAGIMGATVWKYSMTPAVAMLQWPFIFSYGHFLPLIGLIAGMYARVRGYIQNRTLLLVCFFCSGVIPTTEGLFLAQCASCLWAIVLLFELYKKREVEPNLHLLYFALVLTVLFPIAFRVTWDHHLLFVAFGAVALLWYPHENKWRTIFLSFVASLLIAVSRWRVDMATFMLNEETITYDAQSIRMGTLGILFVWLAIESAVRSRRNVS